MTLYHFFFIKTNSPNYYSIPSDPFTLVFSTPIAYYAEEILVFGIDGVTNYICMLIEGQKAK